MMLADGAMSKVFRVVVPMKQPCRMVHPLTHHSDVALELARPGRTLPLAER